MTALAAALVALFAVLGPGLVAPDPAHAAVAKGIVDVNPEGQPADSADRAGMIREIDSGLRAQWIRLIVSWAALDSVRGTYAPTELARLDALIGNLHNAGVKVILTTCYLPDLATDPYRWSRPPAGFPEGPQPFHPIRSGALKDYGNLAEFLARRYRVTVQALECWNEPSIWVCLYPQCTDADPYFAARAYLRKLKAFHAGAARPHRRARSRRRHRPDRPRRPPPHQSASLRPFLGREGAARYFDVYSHHAYTPGGSIHTAPDQPPNDPTRTVTLYNLRTLLRLFPSRPFYLTEYRYSTRPSLAFGGFFMSGKVQARHLRTAYRYASEHRQVKLLVWLLARDVRPASGSADQGIYSSLRRAYGERKLARYAFRRL